MSEVNWDNAAFRASFADAKFVLSLDETQTDTK